MQREFEAIEIPEILPLEVGLASAEHAAFVARLAAHDV